MCKRMFARDITIYSDRIAVYNFSHDKELFGGSYHPTTATKLRIARLLDDKPAHVAVSAYGNELYFWYAFGESRS